MWWWWWWWWKRWSWLLNPHTQCTVMRISFVILMRGIKVREKKGEKKKSVQLNIFLINDWNRASYWICMSMVVFCFILFRYIYLSIHIFILFHLFIYLFIYSFAYLCIYIYFLSSVFGCVWPWRIITTL